jgi:hypothetical protein
MVELADTLDLGSNGIAVQVQVLLPAPPKDDSFDTKCREKNPRFFGGFSLPMHQFCLNDNHAAGFRYAIFYIPHSIAPAHCTNFYIASDDFWCMASISHTAFVKISILSINHTAFSFFGASQFIRRIIVE